MKALEFIGKKTLIAACVGLTLALYSFIANTLPINFFWESGPLSYIILASTLGIILVIELLIGISILNKKHRTKGRKVLTIIFLVLVVSITTISLSSNSLKIARDLVSSDKVVQTECGEVTSFGWLDFGSSISTISNNTGTYTTAFFTLIAHGKKSYCLVSISLSNDGSDNWQYEITDIKN